MRENFDRTMDFVLKWEGYKSDDPADPGGRTIFGISAKAHPIEVAEMWDLPKEEALAKAKEIYLSDYWIPTDCDNLEYPMDLIVMDVAVNMGVGRSNEFKSQAEDWKEYLLIRIQYYMKLKDKYPRFIIGWLNRVVNLYNYVRTS